MVLRLQATWLLDRTALSQHSDLGCGESPIEQHRLGMFAGRRWRPLNRGRRTAQTRRRCGLNHSVHLYKGVAGLIVRVERRLIHVQHRRNTGIGALQQSAPIVTGLRAKDGRQLFPLLRPLFWIVLIGQRRIVCAQLFKQQRIEVGLDRANGHMFAVGAGIGAIERCAAVEQIGAPFVAP